MKDVTLEEVVGWVAILLLSVAVFVGLGAILIANTPKPVPYVNPSWEPCPVGEVMIMDRSGKRYCVEGRPATRKT